MTRVLIVGEMADWSIEQMENAGFFCIEPRKRVAFDTDCNACGAPLVIRPRSGDRWVLMNRKDNTLHHCPRATADDFEEVRVDNVRSE